MHLLVQPIQFRNALQISTFANAIESSIDGEKETNCTCTWRKFPAHTNITKMWAANQKFFASKSFYFWRFSIDPESISLEGV